MGSCHRRMPPWRPAPAAAVPEPAALETLVQPPRPQRQRYKTKREVYNIFVDPALADQYMTDCQLSGEPWVKFNELTNEPEYLLSYRLD